MARVLVSLEDARAVDVSMVSFGALGGLVHVRSWRISCEASWTISLGDFTAKLDHFFMAAP